MSSLNIEARQTLTPDDRAVLSSAIRHALLHNIGDLSLASAFNIEEKCSAVNAKAKQRHARQLDKHGSSFLQLLDDHSNKDNDLDKDACHTSNAVTADQQHDPQRKQDQNHDQEHQDQTLDEDREQDRGRENVQRLPSFSWSTSASASVLQRFLQNEYQSSVSPTSVADNSNIDNKENDVVPSEKTTPANENRTTTDTETENDNHNDDDNETETENDVAMTTEIDMRVVDPKSDFDIDDDYFLHFSQTSSSTSSSALSTSLSSKNAYPSTSEPSILLQPKLVHNNSMILSRKPPNDSTASSGTTILQSSKSASLSATPATSGSTTAGTGSKLDMVVLAAQQEAAAASILKDVRATHSRLRKSASSFRNGQTPVWALLAQRQGKLKPEAAAEMARARMAAATAAAVMRDMNANDSESQSESHSQPQSLPQPQFQSLSKSKSQSQSVALALSQQSRSLSHPPLHDLFEHPDDLEPHQDFMNEYVSPTYRSLSDRVNYALNMRRPPNRLIRPASLEVPTPRARSIEKKNVSFAEGTVFHMKK